MKKYIFLFLASMVIFSCSKDDLSWQDEIESIKTELVNQKKLIEALQANANITSVKQDKGQYTISFSNGQAITLQDGTTPIITIGDNGDWFINNTDTGNPSCGTNGVTPTIEIKDGYWCINGEYTKVKAECVDGKNAPTIETIIDNGFSILFSFSDKTSIEVPKLGGFYYGALGNINGIATMGASLISYPNNWVELACKALNVNCFNYAKAGVGTPQYFANKIWRKEYCTDEEFDKMDILVIQFASSENVYYDGSVSLADYPQDNIEEHESFPERNAAKCLDYILRYWQNWCYIQKDTPSSKWYNTTHGKPFRVILVTHWHDAREVYNEAIRKVAEKWGVGICELDKNIGFTKNTTLADGTQISTLYAMNNQELNGITFGWHPQTGTKGTYIQTRMANILINSLIKNFGDV